MLLMRGTMQRQGSRPAPEGQQGFSMLEVMIALTVITIGMLGIAAMQQFAVARNVDAKQLSVATNLAVEMIERIQYSRKNVVSYNGIDVSSASATCPATPNMTNGDCTQWLNRLVASRLPSVRGTVQVTTVGPTSMNQWQVKVQIRWTGLVYPLEFGSIVSLG